jgi:uncharacterized protein YbjT (DUF2867 family)
MGRQAEALEVLGAEETVVADLLNPGSVRGACEGVDAVVSCAGAPLNLGWTDKAGFHRVDFRGHLPLIEEARRAGVGKFVYVSLAGAMALRQTEYAQAHERTVTTLAESGLRYTIVRPTGLFRFFLEMQRLAKRGLLILPGDGGARTNPIHEADAARACGDAIESDDTQIIAGGPEVFTRRRIAEMAFESLGRRPNVAAVPGALFGPAIAGLRLLHPRLGAVGEFGVAVSRVDCIAPAYGTRRLGDYFRAAAGKS